MIKRNNWSMPIIIITILWGAVIIGHSLVSGSRSSVESLAVLNFINAILSTLGIDFRFSHHFIRKLAHFTEYFILGILLLNNIRFSVYKIREKLFNVLFIGILVPVVDEYIQLFVDGRGGEIADVIIDFSGVLTGMILSFMVASIIMRIIGDRKAIKVNYKNKI